MERIPNGRYTKEFREEAVKMATEGGLSVLEISRRLASLGSNVSYSEAILWVFRLSITRCTLNTKDIMLYGTSNIEGVVFLIHC